MTLDGTMVIQRWIWWLFLFFRQSQLNHEAWLDVFSAWMFHRHVFKLAFSAHSELTFWVNSLDFLAQRHQVLVGGAVLRSDRHGLAWRCGKGHRLAE